MRVVKIVLLVAFVVLHPRGYAVPRCEWRPDPARPVDVAYRCVWVPGPPVDPLAPLLTQHGEAHG